MFWNPFHSLVMLKNYPLAKVRRSSLAERFKATFEIFIGDIDILSPNTNLYLFDYVSKSHLGLIDYLFFPIFLPIAYELDKYGHKMDEDKIRNRRNLINALYIVKLPFAAIFTILVSPLVLGFHGVRSIINWVNDQVLIRFEVGPNVSGSTSLDVLESADPVDGQTIRLICKPDELCIELENVKNTGIFTANDAQHKPYILSNKENAAKIDWILKSNFFHVLDNNFSKDVQALSNSVEHFMCISSDLI